MPKIKVTDSLRGEIPVEALPASEVAKNLGISLPAILAMIKNNEIPGWIYMGRYYYCIQSDVVNHFSGQKVDQKND